MSTIAILISLVIAWQFSKQLKTIVSGLINSMLPFVSALEKYAQSVEESTEQSIRLERLQSKAEFERESRKIREEFKTLDIEVTEADFDFPTKDKS